MKNKKYTLVDLLVACVMISSISLRNYPYLLYIIQIIFILFCSKFLLNKIPKKYFFSKILFLLVAICSLLWADNTNAVIKVLPSIIQIFIICILLSSYVNSTEKILLCIDYVIYASIFLIINLVFSTSISEWKDILFYSSNAYVDVASSAGRLGATISMHPNEFGAIIVICILCTFYKFYNTKNKKYIFLLVILSALLILSKSRASLLEAIIGIFLVYIYQQRTNIKKFKTVVMSILFSIIILWSIINIPVLYNLIGYRMEGILNIFNEKTSIDASASTRIEFIKIGISIFMKNPLLGVGMNNYSVVAYQEYSTWAQVYAHNNYIELLADIGIIGFIIYYMIYIISFIKLKRAINYYRISGENEKLSITSFLVSLLLICSIIGFSHITYDNECIQYMTLLIIMGSYLLSNNDKINKNNM